MGDRSDELRLDPRLGTRFARAWFARLLRAHGDDVPLFEGPGLSLAMHLRAARLLLPVLQRAARRTREGSR